MEEKLSGRSLALIAGAIGSLLGALLWYYIGVWVGADRLKQWSRKHGRWLTITPDEIDRSSAWFQKHGGKAVLLGRLVPAVRTFISVPAGVSGMRLGPFLTYSAIGTSVWTGFLATAGYLLESQYTAVADWVGPVSNVIIAGIVLWYVYRVITFRRKVSKDA
ncbi:DedA family protein [Aquibium oceanicum]|uniref:Alkaline phosphatase n=1 Tax=Aquibium oceanicum TaxID=1670800 RepID=A0A1L3SXZ8_9HYPH|nr:DedA family protein [Aquibium oceanicum]APH74192.1 alkaline phosphatase [Aquibium oceanicum]